MKLFNNIKIRSKLLLSFMLLNLMVLVLGLYSVFQIGGINNSYKNVIDYSVTAKANLLDAETHVVILIKAKNVLGILSAANDEQALEEMQYFAAEGFTAYSNAVQNFTIFKESMDKMLEFGMISQQEYNIEIALLDKLLSDLYMYNYEVFMKVYDFALEFRYDELLDLIRARVYLIETMQADIKSLISSTVRLIDAGVNETLEAASLSYRLTVSMVVFINIIALIFAFVLSRAFSKPIHDLVARTWEIRDGQFNTNIRIDYTRKDEFGRLMRNLSAVSETVQGITNDVSTMAHELEVNGDLDYRMDEDKYKGEYATMVKGLNHAIENFVEDMFVIISVLRKINVGDFDVQLKTLPGKKAVANNAVDELRQNLNAVKIEIDEMVESAADKGDLEFHIDSSKYQGDWKDIMDGLNHIAEAVDAPVVEIRDVMKRLSEGMFDKRVTGKYQGDFLSMQQSVNGTLDAMSSYIDEITDILQKVDNGDLTHIIKRPYVGNFDVIKQALNHIIGTLNKTITEISSASAHVLSGAKQIATSSMNLAGGAQLQSSSVQELHATIDTINEQTQKNAINANEANDLSDKSTQSARQGNEAMKGMLDAMTQIKLSSNSISKIIKDIQEITFQTNLLSLNAAVEAARAGEHGKGFMVVAEEVRNLATRSQSASSETTSLIEDSIKRVESGVKIANSTAESLDVIVKGARELQEIVNSIAKASKEQATAIEQVGTGLLQISEVIQNNSAVSEEVAAASEELNSQAEVLQQLVSYFRL